MARKGTVRTNAGLPGMIEDPVFLEAGYALPRTFTAFAEVGEGLRVTVEVEIVDRRRAVGREMTIVANAGISSTTLRKIPVRDVIATGCLNELWKVRPSEDDPRTFAVWKPEKEDASEVRRIVQTLVGYNPEVPEVAP